MAEFAQVVDCLKAGGIAWRLRWTYEGKAIMRMVPQRIPKEVVPRMTSLQDVVKKRVSAVGSGEIEYHDQVLVITLVDDETTPALATHYTPTWEDIFADDWVLMYPNEID